MAYYYYYQQQNTSPEPLSPGTTATESTPPPLLLLSSPQQQNHINIPLLTPLLPSVTTSVPMTTTSANTENNQQQQQLPTPNTFIRHCDDMGLFHDLQNIVVMSSLNGDTTSVPVSTTATMVTTSASTASTTSNLFGLSSTAILTTMMMANPFDETFKQAVLQKQKNDANFPENCLSNNNNDNGDELNTPFIAITTDVNKTKNSTLTDAVTTDMMTTAVRTVPSTTVESIMTTESQPQQQSLFVTSSTAEATTSGVLVMMMEPQQQHVQNSIVSIQSQQHQKHPIAEREFIVPATTTTTSVINKTITCHDQNYYNGRDVIENDDKVISVENEKTTIKQTLKHNLIAKQFLQEWQKSQLVSENNLEYKQHNKNIDVSSNKVNKKIRISCDDNNQEDEVSRNQQLKQKQKQDLLERNRSAAKRCRIKRKQRWELLSEENRRLKIENSRLRDALMKLINRRSGDQPQ